MTLGTMYIARIKIVRKGFYFDCTLCFGFVSFPEREFSEEKDFKIYWRCKKLKQKKIKIITFVCIFRVLVPRPLAKPPITRQINNVFFWRNAAPKQRFGHQKWCSKEHMKKRGWKRDKNWVQKLLSLLIFNSEDPKELFIARNDVCGLCWKTSFSRWRACCSTSSYQVF